MLHILQYKHVALNFSLQPEEFLNKDVLKIGKVAEKGYSGNQ
jgi:hypothetical protein